MALAALIGEHLPEVGYHAPEGTYIGWLDFRRSRVAHQPAAFKEQAGVLLTEGVDCGAIGAGFARFIFATPLPVMEQAIARMGQALAPGLTWYWALPIGKPEENQTVQRLLAGR